MLPGERLKESFELCQSRIECGLVQPLPKPLFLLAGEMLLECGRLFNAKCPEVSVIGVLLGAMQGLRSSIHG